jgi:hypothetical protein
VPRGAGGPIRWGRSDEQKAQIVSELGDVVAEVQYVERRGRPATHKHVFLIELSIETHGRLPIPFSPL